MDGFLLIFIIFPLFFLPPKLAQLCTQRPVYSWPKFGKKKIVRRRLKKLTKKLDCGPSYDWLPPGMVNHTIWSRFAYGRVSVSRGTSKFHSVAHRDKQTPLGQN